MTNTEMETKILGYMKEHPTAPLSADELLQALTLEGADLKLFWTVMKELEDRGQVIKTRFNTYGLPAAMGLVVGRCQVTSKGFAFVIPEEKTEDRGSVHPGQQPQRRHGRGYGDRPGDAERL